MSYTYLQEQGEESSAECFSDIPAYVLSRLSLTAAKCCSGVNETASCRGSRSGTTCEPSTADLGAERLMPSAGGSRARILAQPDAEQGSKGREAGFGVKWSESSGRYDPESRLWKTRQLSLLEGLDVFSETWPNWGWMRDGEWWELATPARFIAAGESGFLPTPNCSMDRSPCPKDAVRAVTKGVRENGAKITLRLQDYVAAFGPVPTPTRSMAKGATIAPRKDGSLRTKDRLDYWVMAHFGGKSSSLNPLFVEWVMGWPIEWTGLEPLATDRFQQWLKSHGKSLH